MKKIIYQIVKYITLFISGAIVYMALEIIWRGYTFISMGILGGICLILVGLINEIFKKIPLLYQGFIGSIIITLLEYCTGVLLNIKLGLHIWDYSNLPFNVDGQVCLLFSLIWVLLSVVASIIDDSIRHYIFKEPKKDLKLI